MVQLISRTGEQRDIGKVTKKTWRMRYAQTLKFIHDQREYAIQKLLMEEIQGKAGITREVIEEFYSMRAFLLPTQQMNDKRVRKFLQPEIDRLTKFAEDKFKTSEDFGLSPPYKIVIDNDVGLMRDWKIKLYNTLTNEEISTTD